MTDSWDEPTRATPPPPPPSQPLGGDEPTRVIPAIPPPLPPDPPRGPGGPPPGGLPDPNRGMLWVLLGLAAVLVILLIVLFATRKSKSASSAATTSAPSTSTSSTSTSTSSTTSTPSTTPSTSTTTSSTSTTSTTLATRSGNRPPTTAEQAKITSDVDGEHAGYRISLIRISNSDSTWAALEYQGTDNPQQQPASAEIRHLSGGRWESVNFGSTMVDCDPRVPASVQSDFQNLPPFAC